MKGVVLAGGLGTRLRPMTEVVNKHVLDLYDEPMIHFPVRTLARAGIVDLVVVVGRYGDQVKEVLGTGSALGVSIVYAEQEGEGGIADALAQARPEVGDGRVVVILGDQVYQDDLRPYVDAFRSQPAGARILLKQVEDASRFGVASVAGDRITRIDEKPDDPPSDLAVTGCYMYDAGVFGIVEGLEPSARGELEITDVNNAYIARGEMAFDILPGWWADAGTHASKLKASILVALTKGVTFHA
ncbi:MAG TPA: sugar phosphate nucleotidyltransferase [Gaiellales bacterium]|nr:sugar phosphate nucleotidyltransferase [Gaiellales bacterium]